MGSLMSGWDSLTLDPKTVKYQRNTSFTRKEIEAFWKSKKQEGQECEATSTESSPREQKQEETRAKDLYPRRTLRRSSSLPLPNRKNLPADGNNEDKIKRRDLLGDGDYQRGGSEKSVCWWTRSNWAFLNEPPVIETEGLLHRGMHKNCEACNAKVQSSYRRQVSM